ncbi:MAG TPA: acetyl-CoA C-acyltransferase, partial [Solirubrobacteraceae bacterium]|nr:acetyl-CoA C-acyltransferase [Solirubrobacteraceae bacterium]
MSAAYVYEAVRTPFGRYGGALAGIRPDDLAAEALKALLARVPALDPEQIDDVIYGTANGSGEDNRNVARMALLLAGWPTSVPGATVNRLCGSSLEASIQAARAIEAGDASIIVAGGGESMSRAPWILQKPAKGFPANNETLYSSALGWRMVNPNMPSAWTISLGESTEKLVALNGITREQQDEFALRSHQLAAKAYADGVLREVVPVPEVELTQDESIRADTSLEKLAKLKPAFAQDGTVTAGNSSPLNDGAAAILFADEASADTLARAPLARVVAKAAHGVDP